jgi:catechol 2,3-dioxygenase-like lactoylglutathione lyase family enzyme
LAVVRVVRYKKSSRTKRHITKKICYDPGYMQQTIATITYVVRGYDEAIAFFVEKLGFDLIEDTCLELEQSGKRWVIVKPKGSAGCSLLLAKAVDENQLSVVGNQSGGRVFLFLHTDDFWRDYEAMQAKGIAFTGTPRNEAYGTVAVFIDLYGNKWDLIEPSTDVQW